MPIIELVEEKYVFYYYEEEEEIIINGRQVSYTAIIIAKYIIEITLSRESYSQFIETRLVKIYNSLWYVLLHNLLK